MQNAIDNARFVTESANKKIRTSHNISDGALNDFSRSDEIFIIDNVGAVKYCYMFDGANNALTVAKIAPTEGSYGAANDCSAAGFTGNFSNVVGGGVGIGSKISVTGGFFVKNTDEAINDRGFVRTVIVIEYNDTALSPSERDKVLIQSSVSIRDY